MTVLELERVTKRFGSRVVVDGVSFTVARGEVLALLGPSGSGKTTLLRLLAGLEAPDAGRILVGGEVVAGEGRFVPAERRRMGFVFQSFALFPHLDVEENVRFGARDGSALESLLERVRLTARRKARIETLSGGEQQRVAVARALAADPRVVLLDEPFANLDAALRRVVREELAATLRSVQATAVLVTHDAAEAYGMADRLVVLEGGRVLQTGTPEEVYRAPVSLEVAERTGETVTLRGRVIGPGLVACALGDLALAGSVAATGEVTVALRPETIVLGRGGTPARVIARIFEGATTSLQLAVGDEVLVARVAGRHDGAAGDEVKVSVDGPVSAFAR